MSGGDGMNEVHFHDISTNDSNDSPGLYHASLPGTTRHMANKPIWNLGRVE
jgi:hypothetical protein